MDAKRMGSSRRRGLACKGEAGKERGQPSITREAKGGKEDSVSETEYSG